MISIFDVIAITTVLIINILSILFCCKGNEVKGFIWKALGDGISLVYLCILAI